MPLPDDKRSQLDSIVSKMESSGEKPEDIQFVVNDFKSKYGGDSAQDTVAGNTTKPGFGKLRQLDEESQKSANEIADRQEKAIRGSDDSMPPENLHLTPKDVGEMAPLARYGIPAAVGSSGVGILGLGAAGLAGETLAQKMEQFGGERKKMSLPSIAASTAGNMVPGGKGVFGVTARGLQSGAQAGLASGITKQISGEGQGSLGDRIYDVAKETGSDAAFGGGTGLAFGASGRYAPKLIEAGKSLISGEPRQAVANLWRPFRLSPSQMEARDARKAIQDATGIDVPVGVGEAMNTPGLANSLQNVEKGYEIPPETKDEIKRQVEVVALNLRNSGISENDLAKHTVDTIRKQIGEISAPAKKAVAEAAAELHPKIKQAFNEIQNEAKSLVPGSAATPTSFGEKVRDHIQGGLGDIETAEQNAWSAAKNNPDYATVTVVPKNTQQWYSDLKAKTVQLKNQNGPAGKMFPEGTSPFASTVPELENAQTLEQMRGMRTRLGKSFGKSDPLFADASDYEKKKLYSEITKDIDDALNTLPGGNLKLQLKAAEKITKGKYDTFDNPVIDSALKSYGPEGGANPAELANAITGQGAPSYLAQLRKSIGPVRAAELDKDVQGYLFNHVGQSARNPQTGEVSVGTILNNINSLAPEVRTQYFPNYKNVEALARRESAFSKVDPKKIMENLSIDDPALLREALGASPSKVVMDRVSDAFKKSKALSDKLNGTVAGALKTLDGEGLSKAVQENPIPFMRSLTDGSFSPEQVRRAVNLIAGENPKLLEDLQFHYVHNLLSKSGANGRVGASNLLRDLGTETPGLVTSATGGKVADGVVESAASKAGSLREIADSVLGRGKVDSLTSSLRSLASLEHSGRDVPANPTIMDVLARAGGAVAGATTHAATGIGTIGGANESATLIRKYPQIKYALGAYMLTSPELRKLTMTPINRIDGPQLRGLVNGFSTFMANKVSPESPEAEDIRQLHAEVNR